MTPRPLSDPSCAWCSHPATTQLVLEPARMGMMRDPLTGKPRRITARKAVTAWACAEHADIRDRTGGPEMKDPRSKAASSAAQTSIYDVLS